MDDEMLFSQAKFNLRVFRALSTLGSEAISSFSSDFVNAFDNGGKPLSEGHRDKPSSKPEFFWLIIFIFLTSS